MAKDTGSNKKLRNIQLIEFADQLDEEASHDLKRKEYENRLRKLHEKLVALQEWVRQEGKKICIVFEGRDGAGKGGTI